MKKLPVILLVALIVLGAGAVGGIFFLGTEVERRFNAALSRWDAHESINVRNAGYTRSLLGAEAVSEFGVEGLPVSIRFHHAIVYPSRSLAGIAEVTTTLEIPASMQKEVAPLFGDSSPLKAKTVIQWDGTFSTDFSSPPVRIPASVMGKVEWQGVQGTLEVKGDHYRMDLTMPGMKTGGGLMVMNMSALGLTLDVVRAGDGLWIGDSTFELGRLEGVMPDEKRVLLEGIRIFSSMREESPGLLHIGFSADSRQIMADDISISKAGYEIEMTRVDRAVMSRMMKTLNKPAKSFSPEQAIAMAARAREDIPKLLRHSPRFLLKRAGFTLPSGNFKANASAEFSGEKEVDANDPFGPLQQLKLKGHLEVAKPLLTWMVQQEMRETARMIGNSGSEDSRWPEEEVERFARVMSEMRIARIERKGLLVDKAGTYVMDLAYDGAEFTLNGRHVGDMTDLLEYQRR